jgi:hypothetical protein
MPARVTLTPVWTDVNKTQRDTWPRRADAGADGCGTVDNVEASSTSGSWTRVQGCKAGLIGAGRQKTPIF